MSISGAVKAPCEEQQEFQSNSDAAFEWHFVKTEKLYRKSLYIKTEIKISKCKKLRLCLKITLSTGILKFYCLSLKIQYS